MIEIIEGWKYDRDQYQYILYHEYEKDILNIKTRETRRGTVTETVGYFNTLDAMVKKVATAVTAEKIAAGEIQTIQEHVAEIKSILTQIRDMMMEGDNNA